MKSHFRIALLLIAFLTVMTGKAAMADTIILFQGSVLVGKVKKDDSAAITLKNYYGTYLIKKIKIDDVFKTNSYDEDIALHKKMKLPMNEKEIIRNYMAGEGQEMEKKTEETADIEKPLPPETKEKEKIAKPEEKETAGDKWTSGRFSFSGTYLFNLGVGQSAIPYGIGGYFALDQGLDFASGGRHPGIPGLRFEGGYVNFSGSSYTMTGFLAAGGLMWAFPSMKNSWGCFVLALMPGASYLNLKISSGFLGWGSGRASGYNFAGQAIFGYQKSFGVVSIFLQARYLYIMAKGGDHMSVGGEVGIGFNAW